MHCGIFVTAASRRSPGSVSVPMWPAVLSYRLPVFGLVGFYPANYLIGISLLPRRLAPLLFRDHEVLRTVSHAYPPPRGTFDTFTHPSATFPLRVSFDLHVLAMPPAFNLSQNQTLQLLFFAISHCSWVCFKTRRLDLFLQPPEGDRRVAPDDGPLGGRHLVSLIGNQ